MKKIFFVTGELSGDRIAAWYAAKLREQDPIVQIHAVGGNGLEACGAHLYARCEELNVVGIIEIIKHLPFLKSVIKKLCAYIKQEKFDEVILVDFPGFNLWLARKLKQADPMICITYLSPPQLWCWGAWRIKKIKKLCDRVIVMYPFEVSWYAKRGVRAEFLGNPVVEQMLLFMQKTIHKELCVALIPGSRKTEINMLWPIFLQTAQMLQQQWSALRFVVPVASSIGQDMLIELAKQCGHENLLEKITFVDGPDKWNKLARCCVALSKPGTVTLELALLKIPTVIAFKTSWLTYFIARLVVKVPYMGLPNLFLNKQIFPEYIQGQCRPDVLAARVDGMLQDFVHDHNRYEVLLLDLQAVEEQFKIK